MAGNPLLTEESLGITSGSHCHKHHDGRSPSQLSHSPSFVSSTSLQVPPQSFSTPSYQAFHSKPALPSDHKKDHLSPTSLLLPPFCGDKEGRFPSSNHRPFPSQQAPHHSLLQDGDLLKNSKGPCRSTLGMYYRSGRCLLPRPHGLELPQVFGLHCRRPSLCVPAPSLRSVSGSMDLKNRQAHQVPPTSTGNPYQLVPGRLPSPPPFPVRSSRIPVCGSLPVPQSGYSSELRQIQLSSFPKGGVPGCPLSSGHHGTFPSGFQDPLHFLNVSRSSASALPSSSLSGEHCGLHKLRLRASSIGPPKPSPRHLLDEPTDFPFLEGPPCSTGRRLPICSPGLEQSFLPQFPSSNVRTNSGHPTHDGCLPIGLEWSDSSGQSDGSLASGDPSHVHELVGTEGRFPFPGPFPPKDSKQKCTTHDGQHNSSLLHPATGLSQSGSSHVPHQGDSGILSPSFHPPSPEAPVRASECVCGPRLPSRSCLNRVGPGHEDLPVAVLGTGSFSSRLVRHTVQQSTTFFRLTLSRQLSLRGQCPLPSLGQLEFPLPFPSNPFTPRSYSTYLQVPRSRRPHSPVLPSGELVPHSPPQSHRPFSSSTRSLPLPDNLQGSRLPPQPIPFQASRVETMRSALQASGFSHDSVTIVLRAQSFFNQTVSSYLVQILGFPYFQRS